MMILKRLRMHFMRPGSRLLSTVCSITSAEGSGLSRMCLNTDGTAFTKTGSISISTAIRITTTDCGTKAGKAISIS